MRCGFGTFRAENMGTPSGHVFADAGSSVRDGTPMSISQLGGRRSWELFVVAVLTATALICLATGCAGDGEATPGHPTDLDPPPSAQVVPSTRSLQSPAPPVPTSSTSATSESTLPSRLIVLVRFESVEISRDRRSIVVSAGSTPRGYCFAADEGVSIQTIDAELVISVRRSVQVVEPTTTCVPLCDGPVESHAILDEPLPENVEWARPPADAVDTCLSRGNGDERLSIDTS